MMRRELGEDGETLSKSILIQMMNDFLDFFNIGKNMSAAQVMQTVDMILQDYSVLKPDHFALFFNRAKKGMYGKVFDRMDGHIIFDWISQFMMDLSLEIEETRRNEAKRHEKLIPEKPEEGAVPMPEWFKESILKNQRESILPPKKLNQTEEQIYYSQLLRDFDDLHKLQGSKEGFRIVEMDGQKMDSYQYIQYRINHDSIDNG